MKPCDVLVIAGFDPSAGAGVLADVKTIEAHGLNACAAITAWTLQDDRQFQSVTWLPIKAIQAQIRLLLNRFSFSAVKIGLLENLAMLKAITESLQEVSLDWVLWDPILKSSTGFSFHEDFTPEALAPIWLTVNLLTPNRLEWEVLARSVPTSPSSPAVYLKGGHQQGGDYQDHWLEANQLLFSVASENHHQALPPKHGSGCVLSSALLCGLAQGLPPLQAAQKAKAYVERFLLSDPSLMGIHDYTQAVQSRCDLPY